MPRAATGLFVPGWGAPAALYQEGLPDGWAALDPPRFGDTAGSLEAYRRWLVGQLDSRATPVELAGHSMGGALAILAAAARPNRVERLVLLSPAGLPLSKPFRKSLGDFAGQLASGRYPLSIGARAGLAVAQAPRAALRLAQALRHADLSPEMKLVYRSRIPSTVIGCLSDTLVTASHCEQVAARLGSVYRELGPPGGHMWMLNAWPQMRLELASTAR